MTKQETEQIIDTINQLSEIATDIIDAGNLQPDEVFSQIKPYLGSYCGIPKTQNITLNKNNLSYCKQYIKSNSAGYYAAIEFLDIDIDPIQEIAEYLDELDYQREADLVWDVVNTVREIQKWANHQSKEIPEITYDIPTRKTSTTDLTISEEEFIALFDDNISSNKAKLLLDHILEVSNEKGIHTYYGALADECTTWFRYEERDFSNLTRKFLSVAGLDPSLAGNVRKTKLGVKVIARAKDKVNEISKSRLRR